MSEETADEAEAPNQSTLSIDKIVDERGVPLGNVLKEVTRKLGRMNEMSTKLDMILQNQSTRLPDEGARSDETDIKVDAKTKHYVQSELSKLKQGEIEEKQNDSLEQVFKTFPELNKSSEDFDNDFFNLAVKYEGSMDRNDPERPMKAAKLAALDVGKIERIQKAKLLQDETRRTRMITEGSSPTKESNSKKPQKSQMNDAAIQKWFKIDSKKVKAMMKEEEA